MIKLTLTTILIVLVTYLSYETKPNRLTNLNSKLNHQIHSNLTYTPVGYINCSELKGGLNNQLEQLWFLNILAQLTGRGLVENPLKLIDKLTGPKVNISEIINRPKYLNNLPTIQQTDYFRDCGPYIKHISLPNRDWLLEDQMKYIVNAIINTPNHICINVGHFPNYKFFSNNGIINWLQNFKEFVLPNFEFSRLIKSQADYFIKENSLEDGDYISVQFRRGDFKEHCSNLFIEGYENWAFSYLLGEKFKYNKTNWEEFELHCYPSITKLSSEVVKFNKNLSIKVKKILLMTNANSTEILDLKNQLTQSDLTILRFEPNKELIPSDVSWTITHSLAVEMELGLRGNYLIGNRHSSIFSNLLALRVNNKDEDSNLMV